MVIFCGRAATGLVCDDRLVHKQVEKRLQKTKRERKHFIVYIRGLTSFQLLDIGPCVCICKFFKILVFWGVFSSIISAKPSFLSDLTNYYYSSSNFYRFHIYFTYL